MSRRPWPDDAHPTADQLLEWCRTGMTADVTPYLDRLIGDAAAMHATRMRARLSLAEVLAPDIMTVNEALGIHAVLRDDTHYIEIPRVVLSRLLEEALS